MTLALINSLKSLRERWGLSISDLAELMKVNERTLYKWEAHEALPSLPYFLRWCDALGADLNVGVRK